MKYQVARDITLYVDKFRGTTLVTEEDDHITVTQICPEGKNSDQFIFDVDKKEILFETLGLNYALVPADE